MQFREKVNAPLMRLRWREQNGRQWTRESGVMWNSYINLPSVHEVAEFRMTARVALPDTGRNLEKGSYGQGGARTAERERIPIGLRRRRNLKGTRRALQRV